ncbi:8-amino-7-oxononanoate synthase [hydrothermal vent metagenome]|uniref:8-amino-7-oxononanoate synthase n=1 Tax=hydrothermal vent metagenome TaxID=652676 RepID=A0A1W1BI03_9ZZZZ
MIKQTLQQLKKDNLYRQHKTVKYTDNNQIIIDDKKLINFSSNDYLSLANNKKVKNALIEGLKHYPIGSGASHLITGHTQAHENLSKELADYIGCEKVLLFSTGYLANLAVFSSLKSEINWVLQDKLNHASLIDANQLIGLPVKRYKHKNLTSLNNKLIKQQKQGLIASDLVFSMDGDRADVKELNTLKKDNFLLLDDAHGFGILKNEIADWNNVLYMGTFGKAFGTQGACVGGNADLIDFLIQKARPYIYTTAISPALCTATSKSLEIIKTGQNQKQLFDNINFFKEYAKKLNLDFSNSNSAIMPLIIGSSKTALNISKELFNQGFLVWAIREPTIPPNTARLRITLSSAHTKQQIKDLLTSLKKIIMLI